MIEEKVYYDEKVLVIEGYNIKIGFVPETKFYVAVRDHDPFFCFTGNTIEEVKKKAEGALSFYKNHGLKE